MKFRSVTGLRGSPGTTRRPSTSTRVRVGPRPRRSTVAMPCEPLEMPAPWFAVTCGRLFSRSSVRVTPCSLTSALPTTVIGLALVRLGCGMREPVTTTSETSALAAGAAAVCAAAWVADTPARATPQIIEEANRRSRMDTIFKIKILQQSVRGWPRGRAAPHSEKGRGLREARQGSRPPGEDRRKGRKPPGMKLLRQA
jgi:hypothetical protein